MRRSGVRVPTLAPAYRGVAQLGSAFGSGPKGRWFKSSHLDHQKDRKRLVFGLFFCFDERTGRRNAEKNTDKAEALSNNNRLAAYKAGCLIDILSDKSKMRLVPTRYSFGIPRGLRPRMYI